MIRFTLFLYTLLHTHTLSNTCAVPISAQRDNPTLVFPGFPPGFQTSSTTSIGALSYLAVRCYQHTRQRQFRAMECVVTRTTQFTLLSSLVFLCIVPQGMLHRSTSSTSLNFFQDLLKRSFSVKTCCYWGSKGSSEASTC